SFPTAAARRPSVARSNVDWRRAVNPLLDLNRRFEDPTAWMRRRAQPTGGCAVFWGRIATPSGKRGDSPAAGAPDRRRAMMKHQRNVRLRTTESPALTHVLRIRHKSEGAKVEVGPRGGKGARWKRERRMPQTRTDGACRRST